MNHFRWTAAARVARWLALTIAANGCAHVAATAQEPGAERPLEAEELLVVAAAAEQLGDGLRAQQYLLSALRVGADAQRALPWLLRLYVNDSQYRLAIDTAREYLRVHPRDTGLRMLLAGLYEATELEAGALEQYERVIATSPDEARAHFALASLLHERGREPGRADTHFRAYLSLDPRGENADEARAALLTELP
jgi:tetratricopeptide (TPR) repeat protein